MHLGGQLFLSRHLRPCKPTTWPSLKIRVLGFLIPNPLHRNHEIEQQADAQATIFAAYQARLKVRTTPCGPSQGYERGGPHHPKTLHACTAGMLAPTALPVLHVTGA